MPRYFDYLELSFFVLRAKSQAKLVSGPQALLCSDAELCSSENHLGEADLTGCTEEV